MSRAYVCELRASMSCDNQNKNREKLCSTVQSPFGMVWQARCIFLASVNAVPRSASFEEICRAVSDTSPRGHTRAAERNDKIKKPRFHDLLITRPASPVSRETYVARATRDRTEAHRKKKGSA
ncbi:unnamed protein product [Ixodes pacificus]